MLKIIMVIGLCISALVSLCSLNLLVYPTWLEKKVGRRLRRGSLLAVLLLSLVVSVLLAANLYATTKKSDSASQPKAKTTSSQPDNKTNVPRTDADSVGATTYKLAAKTESASTVRYTVITSERDEKALIDLNDTLYSAYKADQTKKAAETKLAEKPLYIDYFDDATVAKTYLKDILKADLSQAQKDDLYKHYIALMLDSPALKQKTLYLQSRPAKVLKKY